MPRTSQPPSIFRFGVVTIPMTSITNSSATMPTIHRAREEFCFQFQLSIDSVSKLATLSEFSTNVPIAMVLFHSLTFKHHTDSPLKNFTLAQPHQSSGPTLSTQCLATDEFSSVTPPSNVYHSSELTSMVIFKTNLFLFQFI